MPESGLSISLSAVQAYRRCQQAYAYAYVDGLKTRVTSAPIQLGSVLHTYLETLYRAYQDGATGEDVHQHARAAMRTQYEPALVGMANTAKAMGQWEEAETVRGLLPKAERIADRYYDVRGRTDADAYEVLAVEQTIKARVTPGIISTGVADLVLRDRVSQRVLLVEHKTTTSVPSHGYRLRDLQTTLYIAKLRRYGLTAHGVLWNYLLTKEPEQPEFTQAGRPRKPTKKNTWATYQAAIAARGLDVTDFADACAALLSAEEDVFFPRFEYTANVEERLLLEDYRTSALDIAEKRAVWAAGTARPVRTLSRDCDYCDFASICTDVLTGRDPQVTLQTRFSTPADRRQAYGVNAKE